VKGSTVSRRASEFIGVALFAAAMIWMVALATYEPSDPVPFFSVGLHADTTNFAGRVGAFLAELSFQLVGYAAYLLPVFFVVVGWHYFWCRSLDARGTKATGAALLFVCVSAFLSLVLGTRLVGDKQFRAGGYAGDWLASLLASYLNRTGSVIVVLTLIFLSIIMSTQFSFGRLFGAILKGVAATAAGAWSSFHEWREERRRQQQRREVIAKHTRKGTLPPEIKLPSPPEIGSSQRSEPPKPGRKREEELAVPPFVAARPPVPPKPPRVTMPAPPLPLADPEPTTKAPAERRKGEYTLPPAALLDPARTERKIDERELMDGARLLEEKCREFSVEGAVVQIHPGPVVTTFEFKPDAGVKYSKITGLADDLCLAMQAESVLIDRIPGKSTVGIQIPNRTREQISLRELLESDLYRRSASKLTIALGKTIHGEPFMADLASMPHLLIAGSTGAGKSVGINGMLTSILYRATPDDVRMIMLDPKRLELGMYEDIPHLLTPVVVDPKQAANALRWAVREMEERYKTLAAEGVRNIEQYNRNIQQAIVEKRTPPEGGEMPRPLPFIVVIIDELADLMMVASNEVEESIARLAQMARAVGIHLILATQRPSVDVITGLIKANLPSRISFRVSSKIDSRTILDGNGAEQLLGKGDMLYMPGGKQIARVHGPFVTDEEVRAVADHWRKQGVPDYNQAVTEEPEDGGYLFEGQPIGDDDPETQLYRKAIQIVAESQKASTSYLQRQLRVGYNSAARLIERMEKDGLVGQPDHVGRRELLIDTDGHPL